ncbi:MAG: hypothetical protein PHV52_00035 [Aliarcobacter sp.]|nr:hypothetical protein [Aliarcobacter sp.]
MIYLIAPTKPIIITDKKQQIVKNQYLQSSKDDLVFYTGVMTYECAAITLESYRSCFPEYEHEMKSINLQQEL